MGVWEDPFPSLTPILPHTHTPIQYKRDNYFSVTALPDYSVNGR